MADAQRLEELRRRVQKDPASLAFAQLAEECRRAGQYPEAVRVCRAGLAHHPDYLSARVTLGRALLGLEHFDQAGAELAGVLRIAPENLAALRGLAEVYQRRGLLAEALEYYRAALALAPHDHEIHAAIDALRYQRPMSPPVHAPAAVQDGPSAALVVAPPPETLAEGLAERPQALAQVPAPSGGEEPTVMPVTVESVAPVAAPRIDAARRAASIRRLEGWLAAIDRRDQPARASR